MRRRALVVIGVLCVLPLVALDPAAVVLLADVQLLELLGLSGLVLSAADLRALALRVYDAPAVLIARAGWALTRQEPRTLITG